MTTSPLEKFIPKITEEYGHARPFDMIGSWSTSFLEPHIQGFKPSGVQIKKSGTVAIKMNSSIQLLVQKKGGIWESARDIFMQL